MSQENSGVTTRSFLDEGADGFGSDATHGSEGGVQLIRVKILLV